MFDRISSPLGAAWTSLLTVLGFGKSFPSTLFFLGLEIPSSKIEIKKKINYLCHGKRLSFEQFHYNHVSSSTDELFA